MKVTIIHPMSNIPILASEASIYCPNNYYYVMPDGSSDIKQHVKTLYQMEKELNEWIRKYNGAMQGLKYWRNKAMEG